MQGVETDHGPPRIGDDDDLLAIDRNWGDIP